MKDEVGLNCLMQKQKSDTSSEKYRTFNIENGYNIVSSNDSCVPLMHRSNFQHVCRISVRVNQSKTDNRGRW